MKIDRKHFRDKTTGNKLEGSLAARGGQNVFYDRPSPLWAIAFLCP